MIGCRGDGNVGIPIMALQHAMRCDAMQVSLLVSRVDDENEKMANSQAPIRRMRATESFCYYAVDFQSDISLTSL